MVFEGFGFALSNVFRMAPGTLPHMLRLVLDEIVSQMFPQNSPCLYLQLMVPRLEGLQTRIAAEWHCFTNQISC